MEKEIRELLGKLDKTKGGRHYVRLFADGSGSVRDLDGAIICHDLQYEGLQELATKLKAQLRALLPTPLEAAKRAVQESSMPEKELILKALDGYSPYRWYTHQGVKAVRRFGGGEGIFFRLCNNSSFHTESLDLESRMARFGWKPIVEAEAVRMLKEHNLNPYVQL